MNISVVIPVFNSIKYLDEAIHSITTQSVKVHEIICVDDASSDGSGTYLAEHYPEIKLFTNENNMGPSYSRNMGIKQSTGSLLSFLDADDKWAPNKLEWQLDEIMKDPDLMIVGGQTTSFSSEDKSIDDQHFNTYLSSLLIKRSVFDKIGLFDESLRLSEDQDWFLRAREEQINYKIFDRIAFFKRTHDSNLTKDLKFSETGFIQALKNSLDRRRTAGLMSNLDQIQINPSEDGKK